MDENNKLREQILRELNDAVSKKKAAIKEQDNEISLQMDMRMSVRGHGITAQAAVNACNNRADTARRKKKGIEEDMVWQSEMLEKYK